MAEPDDPTPPEAEPSAESDTPPKRWSWRTHWHMPLRWRVTKKRWQTVLLRTVVWGFVGVIGVLLMAYTAARLLIKPEVVRSFVIKQVEEQTGGKLDIGNVKFSVLTGVRLENVQFYPPLVGDTRGFLGGGEIEPAPLANLDALEARYSIPKMLAGHLHIKALQLVAPEMHLTQKDGVFNFAGILAYRQVHFPPEAPKPEEKKEEKKAAPGSDILPFSPALLYMPFELLMQNVGIKDLRFDLVKEEKGKVVQIVQTNGLSLDVGLHWFGRESSMWFNMMSTFERPLELEVRNAKDGDLSQAIFVKTALNLHFGIENLKRIEGDIAARLINVKTPIAGYEDLGTFVKMRLVANDDYKGFNFDAFRVELADALTYELGGNISVQDATFEAINIKLAQKFDLDLKNSAALAKPFVPDLHADGNISFDDLKIEGQLQPSKLAEAKDGVGLPTVSGIIWLEDIDVDYPAVGLAMEPLSGAVSLAAGPALDEKGSQVDLSVDLNVPKVEVQQKLPVGSVKAGVQGLVSKTTLRFLFPQMLLPILKVNVEAEHVTASGDKIPTIDSPLFVDIDADGGQDLARAGLSANIELSDLAEFSAMADCQAKCTRFRSSVVARMDALEKLHAIALPLSGMLGLGDFMPTKLTGAFDFQLAARGKLEDPLKTPVPELLKTAEVRFNSQMNLAKLNAQVPFFNVDLKNFETRMLAAGTLAEQKIDITQKFDSVTLQVPAAKDSDKPPMPVSVNRFSFETSVVNNIEGPLNLQTIMQQLATAVDTRLYIGKVAVDGTLPRPISDFQFGVSAEQSHLTDIKIKDLNVRLPDYGTTVGLALTTAVGPDFMPKKIDAKLTTQVVHNGDEKLPAGIKTSGKVDVELTLNSKDMKTLALGGQTSFDKFNVTIPAKDEKSPPTLVVEDISGQIPFKQIVPLPDLKALKNKSATPDAASKEVAKDGSKAPDADKKVTQPAGLADVPIVPVHEGDGDEHGPKTDEKLDQAMDKYFEKNEDKLKGSTNLVAIVDYGTIRPFYPEKRPLSIKRVEAANLELSNMEFDLELRQNWFALNQFVINFLGGKIQGDFQLAFDAGAPNPKQIPKSLRTSVHMTRLDTRKLIERFPSLQGKASSWNLFSNPYIDGTVHLQYDLKSNDIGGGVEITSIGKEQLRMMLFYVDPFEQNPTIGDIRKALALGEVRQVSIPLKNGEVGMDVDVRLLGAPIPTPKLTRFPISQILENFKDQAGAGSTSATASPGGAT